MRRAALAAPVLAAVAGCPALAQEAVQAPEPTAPLTATISQSFELDTNYGLDDPSPGTSYYGDTRVALDYIDQTDTTSFGLGIDTGLRPLWEADEDFDLVLASPSRAYLAFSQEGADTFFDATFRLRSRRVDSILGIDDIDIGENPDLIDEQEEGETREQRTDANIGFALGTNSPSTYEFRLRASDFDYADLDETSRDPRRSVEGEATWTLDITPVLSTIASAGYSLSTTDNEADREVREASADAGLVFQPSDTLRVRGGIGFAERTEEETLASGARVTEEDSGPLVRADFRYNLPDFTINGNARFTTAAPQNRLTGTVRALYTLPRGRVRAQAFQRYSGSGGDDKITGAGIGIERDINTISRVGLDFTYAVQEELETDEPEVERTDLTASYIYDLTEQVSAEMGYGYRRRIEDPDDADSHRVFLVIGRTFETGL